MNFLRPTLMTTAIAIAISSAGIANAAVSATAGAPTITVKYDELDVTTQRGAQELYARLRAASKQVCAPLDSRDLRRHYAWKACYTQALSNAVVQVNREAVTALHQRSLHGERAS
jgi:UrcA family protein